jgi:uncharacterized repeat protein (TIGR03803 family)
MYQRHEAPTPRDVPLAHLAHPPFTCSFQSLIIGALFQKIPVRQSIALVSRVALASISSLALVAFAPLPTLAAPTITRLASFTGSGTGNGDEPYAALTPSGTGTFYGTANTGGGANRGTIFEFNPTGGTITRLASFTGGINGTGTFPNATLTPSGNNTFYGTATEGGVHDLGTIFEFNPTGGTITRLASFTGTGNGSLPFAALTPSGNGKFYGTALFGGDDDLGTIFEFNPTNSTITRLASFTGTGNGSYPYAALTPSGNGTFYGTASEGGVDNLGTIFEFNPTGGTITRLASFTGGINGTGTSPYATLTPSGNNTFYGTATSGGANNTGTLFEFNPTNSTITRLASFTIGVTGPGNEPFAALTPSGNNTFYGTTTNGGANSSGTIFEFNPGNDSAAVPGPLPLLGAGAAFGWSRQLRRRVKLQQPGARPLA